MSAADVKDVYPDEPLSWIVGVISVFLPLCYN